MIGWCSRLVLSRCSLGDLRRRVIPTGSVVAGDFPDVTSSCRDLQDDDPFENPAYTDTVRSTDSTGSALRRSISVPPEYHYKPPAAGRRHAREVSDPVRMRMFPLITQTT